MTAAVPCSAQVTPAAGYIPPDDTPSISVGATIFTDYTYQSTAKDQRRRRQQRHVQQRSTSAAPTSTSPATSIHYIAFRITPDITRETGQCTAGTSLDRQLRLPAQYAFVAVQSETTGSRPNRLVGSARHRSRRRGSITWRASIATASRERSSPSGKGFFSSSDARRVVSLQLRQ